MKKVLALALLVSTFSACDTFKKKEPSTPKDDPRRVELQALYEQRKEALTAKLVNGWLAPDDCDGTLWNGLACAAGVPIEISLAEYAPGEIHRRPAPSCWTAEGGDQGSKSTISNDMLLGYELCQWRRKDYDAIARLAAYGEAHADGIVWVMGQPYPEQAERVALRPNGQGRIGVLLDKLSNGDDKRPYRSIPEIYTTVPQDFQKHLQNIGLLLDGELDRIIPYRFTVEDVAEQLGAYALIDIPKSGFLVLKEQADDNPNDAFAQANLGQYTGDMGPAIGLLLDPNYQAPSYVRGAPEWSEVHWLIAADTVLRAFGTTKVAQDAVE
jgi:hypothetical protein